MLHAELGAEAHPMLPVHKFQVDVPIVVVHVVGCDHQTPLQIESTAQYSSRTEHCKANSLLADTCVSANIHTCVCVCVT